MQTAFGCNGLDVFLKHRRSISGVIVIKSVCFKTDANSVFAAMGWTFLKHRRSISGVIFLKYVCSFWRQIFVFLCNSEKSFFKGFS